MAPNKLAILSIICMIFLFSTASAYVKIPPMEKKLYLVSLEEGISQDIVENYGEIDHKFTLINAVTIKLDPRTASFIATRPGVKSVKEDQALQIGPSASQPTPKAMAMKNKKYGLTILNPKSFPKVGRNWTVKFQTKGKATLIVRAVNGTSWSKNSENKDLKFLELKCGDKTQKTVWRKGMLIAPQYECNQTSYLTTKVLQEGKHTLKFRFRDFREYAYNDTSQWNIKEQGINAENAWNEFFGGMSPLGVSDTVKVAIIDSGVNYDLPDLDAAKYLGGYDYCSTGTGYGCSGEDDDPMDEYGHGTEMASALLAAGSDIYGIAPETQYYALKVGNDAGESSVLTILKAVEWALLQGDVDIIYLGVKSGGYEELYILIRDSYEEGMLYIAPSYDPLWVPAKYSNVFGVGAHTRYDPQEIVSGTGPYVEVLGPGEEVPVLGLDGISTTAADPIGAAGAQAAGALALMLQYSKENGIVYNNSALWETMNQTAIDLGTGDPREGNGKGDVYQAITWMDNNWFVDYHIEYKNYFGVDPDGYPIYYIGWPMTYEVHVTNNSDREIKDINVMSETLYYPGGDPVQGMPDTTEVITSFPSTDTQVFTYSPTLPYGMTPGLDSTQITLKVGQKFPDAIILVNPTADIFCPPEGEEPPLPASIGLTGMAAMPSAEHITAKTGFRIMEAPPELMPEPPPIE